MDIDISWKQRIAELEASGLSLTAIAKEIGLSKSSVSGLKSGSWKAPTGNAAVLLFLLHQRRCGSVSAREGQNDAEGAAVSSGCSASPPSRESQ